MSKEILPMNLERKGGGIHILLHLRAEQFKSDLTWSKSEALKKVESLIPPLTFPCTMNTSHMANHIHIIHYKDKKEQKKSMTTCVSKLTSLWMERAEGKKEAWRAIKNF